MNDENLLKGKATQFQTGEKQARIARKAGIKSGEVKRRKKEMRETLLRLLFEDSGEGTIFDQMNSGLLKRIIETGDPNAYEKIMEYAGLSVKQEQKDEELKLKKEELKLKRSQADTAEKPTEIVDPSIEILNQIIGVMKDESGS